MAKRKRCIINNAYAIAQISFHLPMGVDCVAAHLWDWTEKRCLFSDSHDILKTKASLVFSDMDNGLLCFCQNSPCFYFCWLSQAPWQVPAWGQQPQPACLPFFLLRYILPKMPPTIKPSTMRTTISPDVIFIPPYTPTLTLVSEYLFSRRIRYSIPASTATASTVKMLRLASPVNRPPI